MTTTFVGTTGRLSTANDPCSRRSGLSGSGKERRPSPNSARHTLKSRKTMKHACREDRESKLHHNMSSFKSPLMLLSAVLDPLPPPPPPPPPNSLTSALSQQTLVKSSCHCWMNCSSRNSIVSGLGQVLKMDSNAGSLSMVS